MTDVQNISNRVSVSGGRMLAGWTTAGASVSYGPWAGDLLTLATARSRGYRYEIRHALNKLCILRYFVRLSVRWIHW